MNQKKGFTLIEILVYIVILVIIFSAVFSFLIWSYHYNTKTKVMREVLDNSRRVIEILAYEIREAESIYYPTTTSNQLSLETKHYLPEGENVSYIDFYLCGDRLCLKKESQNPIPLTTDKVEIKDLEFRQIASTSDIPAIQVNFKIDYKNPNNRPELTASIETTTSFSLRAY